MEEEKEVTVKHKDKVKSSFTLSEEVFSEFRDACNDVGMKMSPRLEVLMKRDTEKLKEIHEVQKDENTK